MRTSAHDYVVYNLIRVRAYARAGCMFAEREIMLYLWNISAKVFSRCLVLKSGKFLENGSDGALRSALIMLSFLRPTPYRRVWGIGRIHFSRSSRTSEPWMRNGSTLLFLFTRLRSVAIIEKKSYAQTK